MIPVINKPTLVTKKKHHSDRLLKSEILTGIIKSDISDHFPIFIVSNNHDVENGLEKTIHIYRSNIGACLYYTF